MANDDKSNESRNRKDQMMESFVDTGTDSMTEWGNEFIKTNVPKIMDWITARIKELFSSIKNKSDSSISSSVRKAIQAGIEIGEKNKEQALIKAMVKDGIQEAQIRQILDTSNQFLVTWESIESASRK
ncbi:MAG: hypothetical protein ACYCWE_20365 [Eubacteriales bacterium]